MKIYQIIRNIFSERKKKRKKIVQLYVNGREVERLLGD